MLGGYVLLVVWGLQWVGFWKASLLKDTLIWFLFSGIVISFRHLTYREEESIWAEVVHCNAKIVIAVEFLVGTYTFSLPVELLIVTLAIVLGGVIRLGSSRQEHAGAAQVASFLEVALGLVVLTFTVEKALSTGQVGNLESARKALLPLVLSLVYLPSVYTLRLCVGYQLLFSWLRAGTKKRWLLILYARLRLVWHLRLSRKDIQGLLLRKADMLRTVETKSGSLRPEVILVSVVNHHYGAPT